MSVGHRVQGDYRLTGVLTGHGESRVLTGHGECSQTSGIRFR